MKRLQTDAVFEGDGEKVHGDGFHPPGVPFKEDVSDVLQVCTEADTGTVVLQKLRSQR